MSKPDFSELDSVVSEWGLPTLSARIEKRVTSSLAELQAFHDTVLPRLPEIIDFLNEFPSHAIPDEYQALKNTALTLLHVDRPVNKWAAPTLDDALDPRRFTMKQRFTDPG